MSQSYPSFPTWITRTRIALAIVLIALPGWLLIAVVVAVWRAPTEVPTGT